MSSDRFDLIVIGAGIAGLTAACEAARGGARVACFEQLMFGGLVTNVNELDPAPEGVSGSGIDLASELMGQLAELEVDYQSAAVTAVNRRADHVEVVTADASFTCRALVVASGASQRKLGVPGEAQFEHRGVSSCADCDAPLYQGQVAVVVGGGDSALQEALVLTRFCATVHLVHRRGTFRARRPFIDAIGAAGNLVQHLDSEVEAITGNDGVEAVTLRSLATGARQSVACSAVFAYVGLVPNTGCAPAQLGRNETGHLLVDAQHGCSLPGMFAAGAVRAGFGGSLVDAMADGRAAAAAALRYLGAAH